MWAKGFVAVAQLGVVYFFGVEQLEWLENPLLNTFGTTFFKLTWKIQWLIGLISGQGHVEVVFCFYTATLIFINTNTSKTKRFVHQKPNKKPRFPKNHRFIGKNRFCTRDKPLENSKSPSFLEV